MRPVLRGGSGSTSPKTRPGSTWGDGGSTGGSSSGPSKITPTPTSPSSSSGSDETLARTPRDWSWRGGRPNNSMSVDYQQGLWNDSKNSPGLSVAYRKWWDDNLEAIRAGAGTKFREGRTAYRYAVEQAAKLGMGVNQYAAYKFGVSFEAADGTPFTGDVPVTDSSGGGSGSRRGGGGGGNGGGGGGGGGYGSTTQTRVDFTDPYTARNLINRTLSDSLGRLATEAEIKQFTAALNLAERNNPQTATSTGDSSSSSTVTAGGVDPNQVVLDQVRSGAEYEAFNTDNVFRQAMSILAGRVG